MRPRYLTAARWLLLATVLTLSACVYRINIQQGNFLDPKAVDQLAAGMTRSQVRFLLGTPMVADAFDPDRWDYVYYFKRGRLRQAQKRHVTVFFEEDVVARIDRPVTDKDAVAKAAAPLPEAQELEKSADKQAKEAREEEVQIKKEEEKKAEQDAGEKEPPK